MTEYFSSAFEPFGMLEFSSQDPLGRRVYDSLRDSLGDAFHQFAQDAETYADAMTLSIASLQIDAADGQSDPAQTSYLLEEIERDFGVFPEFGATLADRRALLGVSIESAWAGILATIRAGLAVIFGAGFVDANYTYWGDVTLATDTPVMVPVTTPIKLVTLNSPYGIFPGTQTVSYTRLLDAGNRVTSGDRLYVDPENLAECELVTVTASTETTATTGTITAVFANPHNQVVTATTSSHPAWSSSRNHLVVGLSDAALRDQKAIGRATEYLRKVVPATSTWAFALLSGFPTIEDTGPFQVGSGLVGRTPIR